MGNNRQTLAEFAEEWLVAITPTVKPATLYSYRRNLKIHVLPRIGGRELTKIDAGTPNALYSRLLVEGNVTQGGGVIGLHREVHPRHCSPGPR